MPLYRITYTAWDIYGTLIVEAPNESYAENLACAIYSKFPGCEFHYLGSERV